MTPQSSTTDEPASPPEMPPTSLQPPGFRRPPPTRPPDLLDPTTTTISDESDLPPGSSGDDEREPPPETDSTGTRSSPASTRPAPSAELVGALSEVTRVAVSMLSIAVAKIRARKVGEQAAGVWIAEDDEAAAIGDPLARIAARHVPLGAGASNPDVIDGIEAAMATAGYAGTNARDEHELLQALIREQGGAPPADQP